MLHEPGELQRVVHFEQGVPVVRHEDDTATPHRVEPLSPAEHAEDDLVDGRARAQDRPAAGLCQPAFSGRSDKRMQAKAPQGA